MKVYVTKYALIGKGIILVDVDKIIPGIGGYCYVTIDGNVCKLQLGETYFHEDDVQQAVSKAHYMRLEKMRSHLDKLVEGKSSYYHRKEIERLNALDFIPEMQDHLKRKITDFINQYAKKIFDLMDTAAYYPFKDVEIDLEFDVWKPQKGFCHHNVIHYCNDNVGYEIVCAWLYNPQDRPNFIFIAHSLVRDTNGNIFDITPSDAGAVYPAIVVPNDKDFYLIVDEYDTQRIDYDATE